MRGGERYVRTCSEARPVVVQSENNASQSRGETWQEEQGERRRRWMERQTQEMKLVAGEEQKKSAQGIKEERSGDARRRRTQPPPGTENGARVARLGNRAYTGGPISESPSPPLPWQPPS